MSPSKNFPINFRAVFLMRFFFWFISLLVTYFNYWVYQTTGKLDPKNVLILILFSLVFSTAFQFLRVEEDGFVYKPFPFFPSFKVFWKNIEKVEGRYLPRGGRALAFYDRTRKGRLSVVMSFFKSSDVQKFIEIVSEMAPQAGLSTSKTKSQ